MDVNTRADVNNRPIAIAFFFSRRVLPCVVGLRKRFVYIKTQKLQIDDTLRYLHESSHF